MGSLVKDGLVILIDVNAIKKDPGKKTRIFFDISIISCFYLILVFM